MAEICESVEAEWGDLVAAIHLYKRLLGLQVRLHYAVDILDLCNESPSPSLALALIPSPYTSSPSPSTNSY